MDRPQAWIVTVLFASPWIATAQREASTEPFELLLTGGRVLDGTGNPWFYADVGIRDRRIVAVGKLRGASAGRVLDVSGKVVTPGIIDVHSHGGGVKGGAKLGHCGGVKVDHLRRDDSLSKAAVSGAGTQSGDAW